jgi:5-methylcytosine-specific restriction endonuclease McrA
MPRRFLEDHPTPEDYWRAVILFGANVQSYKFALGKSLLDLAVAGKEFVSLEDLAVPYSNYICQHLVHANKQGTAPTSQFLDACRTFNRDPSNKDELIDATVRKGFENVIDAFHNLGQGGDTVGCKFYEDERTGPVKGIRIREETSQIGTGPEGRALLAEVEARWRLVETAWGLQVPVTSVQVSYDEEGESLFVQVPNKRENITGCRDALNGYQKGHCFYCRAPYSIQAGDDSLADVDHFIPHKLKQSLAPTNIDGMWNLVLACRDCNRGEGGKFDEYPCIEFLDQLDRRNNDLIESKHPLSETLRNQTAETESGRQAFLQRIWNRAKVLLGTRDCWKPR